MNKEIQYLAVLTRQNIVAAKNALATAKQVQKLLRTGRTGRKWRDVKRVKLKSGQLYIVRRKVPGAGCELCGTGNQAFVMPAVVQLWKGGWYCVGDYGRLDSTTSSVATVEVLV